MGSNVSRDVQTAQGHEKNKHEMKLPVPFVSFSLQLIGFDRISQMLFRPRSITYILSWGCCLSCKASKDKSVKFEQDLAYVLAFHFHFEIMQSLLDSKGLQIDEFVHL